MADDREYCFVGLDIGTSKICVVIAILNENDQPELVGIGSTDSRGLRKGIVVNIESTIKSVLEVVDEAEMMSGREVESVTASIAGANIEGINSRGMVTIAGKDREVDRGDMNRVLETARTIKIPDDRQLLHVIPQEFIVDGQGGIRDPLNMIGHRLEASVHMITGSVTTAQNLLKCINRSGFTVNEIVLQTFASARAVLTEDEMEMGVLLLDMGGGTTDLMAFKDGAPKITSVIALGGDQVTNDLSIILKTPPEAAEKLKKESGCCYGPLIHDNDEVLIPGVGGWPTASIHKKEICRVAQPRMEEIFRMAEKHIRRMDFMKNLSGGIVLTGGASLLPGAAELAQEVFGLPARIGYPRRIDGMLDANRSPEYSAVIGLILHSVEEYLQDTGARVERSKSRKGGKLFGWFKDFF